MKHENSRQDRSNTEQAASRFAALNRISLALSSELNETRLLHLIAETARDLTGAGFAAFTLRPATELGEPLVPAEGHLFHLAAVVGVTGEQEALFRRMPLGGEGLLAPIFRHGLPVRVPDALALLQPPESAQKEEARGASTASRDDARQAAFNYAHGQIPRRGLRYLGVPRAHPLVRSFLGAPLLDRQGQVIGGLLLGHTQPEKFSDEDEALLAGLAAQAAVALENARLYRASQMQTQELDAIFERIADGVTLLDGHGTILRENSTARRLREHLHSSPAGEQVIEALLYTPARGALHGETIQDRTVTLHDAHQEAREYLVNASPLLLPRTSPDPLLQSVAGTGRTDASIPGAVVVWHDVTEARRLLLERRVHAETEARRALLQTILDELPSSVYLVRGPDARLVLANRAAATVWGAVWPPGQPIGEFLKENHIRIFAVDGRPLAPEQLATLRAVRHGEAVHQHQEIIRHADGTTLPVLVNAVALDVQTLNVLPADATQHEARTPELAALVVHQDVTALKEAEHLKDEFLGIAAHELRTPLAILKGFAQTLIVQTARGRGTELAEWQMESVEGIDQSISRLIELTEDLLDVTRLQAGRITLHLEPTDVVALARRVVARLQMTTERHHLSLLASSEYLVADVDPRRIEQVLSNLIGNAIKYNPAGNPIEVTVREEAETKMALMSIRDSGIGIPVQQQARIFGRFERADNARAFGIGGTGLGLYLCRELVERHGGRIWFESAEGQGSTFFIAFPTLNDASAA